MFCSLKYFRRLDIEHLLTVMDNATLMFHRLRSPPAVVPYPCTKTRMGIFQGMLCGRTVIDQMHLREHVQCGRMPDHTVGGEAVDQGIGNRVRHRRHQVHAKRHKPEWKSRKQEHAPFETAQARV